MQVVDQVQATRSLEVLYIEHSRTVTTFLRRRCGDQHLAEDLSTETFLNAGRAIDGGQQVTIGWLMTVARRRLIDHWRAAERQARLIDQLESSTCTPDAHHWEPPQAVVGVALSDLPINYQRALHLRYVVQLSVSEVSTHLDLSYRATESLLARSRRQLSRAVASRVSSNP